VNIEDGRFEDASLDRSLEHLASARASERALAFWSLAL
jgi:hypothetical protein